MLVDFYKVEHFYTPFCFVVIFRVVALHKSDYIGMNLGIRGWGKEDVDLFDRFLGRQDLSVFRACDPDFVHVYHPVTCDKTLSKDQVSFI